MKITHTIAALAATSFAANAAIIASYDASVGNPSNAGEVVNPTAGTGSNTVWALNDTTLGASDTQEGAFEGGQGAWRNLDGTGNNNPGYRTTLADSDFQAMFDNGYTFTLRLRLEQGGHFSSVGADGSNTSGSYNFPGDRRIGAAFEADGDDYLVTAVGQGGSQVRVTNGILDETYVRIVISGAAGTDAATWTMFNDDTDALLSTQNLAGWAGGNSSTDDNIGWQSGSSSGANREAFFREVTLETIPEPSSTALLGLGGLALILRRRK